MHTKVIREKMQHKPKEKKKKKKRKLRSWLIIET